MCAIGEAQALQQQLLHHNRVYPWWNALCLLQTNVALSPRVSELHPGISKQTVASGSFMLRGGMPSDISPPQSIPGPLSMLGGGVPPNIALQQSMQGCFKCIV